MARYITITLDKRGVSCTARLLDDEAPATAAAVWDALPLSAPVYHGKYARNEIYALLPQFADRDPGKENTTVTPIPSAMMTTLRPSRLGGGSSGRRSATPALRIDVAAPRRCSYSFLSSVAVAPWRAVR